MRDHTLYFSYSGCFHSRAKEEGSSHQRVHTEERDYRLLVIEENLIACGLIRVSLGESSFFVSGGAELAYHELGLRCSCELIVCELTHVVDVSSQLDVVFCVIPNSHLVFFADMNSLN